MEIRESSLDHKRLYQRNILESTPVPVADRSYQTVWNNTISSGETLLVEHRRADNNVRYSIIQNGNSVKVKPYNLPEEYRRPKTIVELRSLLVAKAIRAVPLSNREIKLWFDEDRMHGADLYEDSWMNFCNHLKELVNPLVLEELGELFIEKSRQDYWDLNHDKISGWIEDLSLSDETVKCINCLSEAIVSKASTLKEGDLIRQFREDLQNKFRTTFPLNENLSETLRLFYSIPEIRRLKNSDLVNLRLELAKEKTDIDTLWPKVKSLLDEEQIQSADSYVGSKSPETVDLYSLLDALLKGSQAEANGFIHQYDAPPEKFVGKTLYLTDPVNGTSFFGIILKASRSEALIFETENQTEIIITPDFRVQMKKKHTYELLPAIIKGYSGDHFEITTKNYREDSLIKPGYYSLVSSKYHSGLMNSGPCHKIIFKGILKNYAIYIFYLEKRKNKSFFWEQVNKIEVETTDREGKLILTNYPVGDFQRNYFVTISYSIEETKSFSEISVHNINKSVIIKDEGNNQRNKLRGLAELNEDEKSLIYRLIEEKVILNKLVDSQIHRSMKDIDYEIVKDSPLEKEIELLADKFEIYLQRKKTPQELLFQLVTKANYVRFIGKEQSLLVANTMELMHRAVENANQMRGKENILVIGETGSGKSTTICHLLSAPMQEFKNKFGDQVWRVRENENQYPIIGQVLGTSETLYCQGYSSDKTKAMITDCAGFEDTRGEEYNLCANLSMDLVIKHSKSIDAIVLVIPIQSFGVGRGNPIINLMGTVSERFPNVLDINHIDHKKLFVLVTKRTQVKPETVNGLPSKIREYLNELNADVRDMEERAKNGEDLEEQLSHLKFKQSVWICLNSMFNDYPVSKKTGQPGSQTRAAILNMRQGAQRLQLLDQYQYHAGDSAELSYCSPMESVQIKRKFHDNILFSTRTWSNLIFKKYLNEMCSNIEKHKHKIEECQIKIDSQKNNLKTIHQYLDKLSHASELLKPIIQEIDSNGVTFELYIEALIQSEIIFDGDIKPRCDTLKVVEVDSFLKLMEMKYVQAFLEIEKLKNNTPNNEWKAHKYFFGRVPYRFFKFFQSEADIYPRDTTIFEKAKNLMLTKMGHDLNSAKVAIEQIIGDLEIEKKDLESNYQQMIAEKKRHAAVIYDQLKMGPLIDKLAELVCLGKEEQRIDSDSLDVLKACEKFREDYKEHFKSLRVECLKDLSLPQLSSSF